VRSVRATLGAVRMRLPLGFVLASLVLVAAGAAPAAGQKTDASASAFGVKVVSPAGGSTGGAVSAPPDSSDSGAFVYGEDIVTAAGFTTRAAALEAKRAKASASSTVTDVSLFGGEITASTVRVNAWAFASQDGASGSLGGSSVAGLTVLEKSVAASPNVRVPLADWGYLVVLEQAVVSAGSSKHGRRVFVSGLHVHLSARHGGLPAGSDITVDYAQASAIAPKPPPPEPEPEPEPEPDPEPSPGGNGDGSGDGDGSGNGSGSGNGGNGGSGGSGNGGNGGSNPPPRDPQPQPPGADPTPPPIVQNPPEDVRPNLTSGGYVFPVYGPDASFTDDFQAPRAATGWHHGNDIFAPIGTPVLAVADGELFLVGLNAIGGNRLWLRDRAGNEFYYAHLSAYTPLAFNGSHVKAGDVIGFVGTSGDAAGTPPHLHFEIHPRGLLWMGYDGVINPYPYLLAWQRLDDLAFDAEIPAGDAPQPGAIILQAEDISSASGLDPAALARVLASPLLFGEAPPVETSSPGFVEPSL
jgi:murein DD-endopeptidase MepM/ murein hydrolase activator NlpD